MTIKFTSAPGRLKYRYLLLVALLAAGLTFGTMFVFGCEETEEVADVVCPEPIYTIREPSDWDKYPQSLIDNCPRIFHKEAPYDFPKLEE